MIEMIAYLAWILFTLAGMGLAFRLLRMDRPRPVRIPVRRDSND
ncbi:MAG: hypothetical protein ACKOC5_00735 [Chloroflexota bacterium]